MSMTRAGIVAAVVFSFPFFSVLGADAPPEGVRAVPLIEGPSLASSPRRDALPPSGIVSRIRATLSSVTGRQPVEEFPRSARSALVERLGRDVRIHIRAGNGTPMEIRGEHLQPGSRSLVALSSEPFDAQTARRFLRENRVLLRLDDPDQELELDRMTVDELGRSHLRFSQRWHSLPVWPAALAVHLDRQGNVDGFDGAYVPTPHRLPIRPAVTAERARVLASEGHPTAFSEAPELIVFAPLDGFVRLAWRVPVTFAFDRKDLVIIDALNGSRLSSFALIEPARVNGSGTDLQGFTRSFSVWQDGSTYYLIDTSKPMYQSSFGSPLTSRTRGSILIGDARNQPPSSDPQELPTAYYITSSSPTSWNLPDAVSALWWFSETYDYYQEVHGRDSFDDQGRSITGIVRLGQNYYNAFWNSDSSTMYFGDAEPFAGSLDVIAHEFTHAVTTSTANLVYRDEPGALNEAMSDVFGEMVEYHSLGSNDWLIGTSLSEPLRSMKSPHLYSQPERMSEYVHTAQDEGGVHTNSGIINHAFYLLAEGMPGAIGRSDAEKIFYRALSVHLLPASQFIDTRHACITSAEELFGMDSTEASKTAEAFDRVEIFEADPTAPPTPFPSVPGSDSTLFLFQDSGSWFLGRVESGLGDPPQGSFLTPSEVAPYHRPAVSGDGSIAFFVNADHDACLIATHPSEIEQCLGYPGTIDSVAMSPDVVKFAMILIDPGTGLPDNRILVIDLADPNDPQSREVELLGPVSDAGALSTIDYADALDFTSDGRYLFYDALTRTTFSNDTEAASWAIYAYDWLRDSEFVLLPPVTSLEIAYPSVSQTSDGFLTFDVADPSAGISHIYTANLFTGEVGTVGDTVGTFGVPVFAGDDSAVVYSDSDTNTIVGTSLVRQGLSSDRLSPSGSRTLWLGDAGFGVIYRRGEYNGPTSSPGMLQFTSSTFGGEEGATTTVTVSRSEGSAGAVTVHYATLDGTANGGADYEAASGTLTWEDGESDSQSFTVRCLTDTANEGTETVMVQLSSPSGGASLGSQSTATINVSNVAAEDPIPAAPSNLTVRPTGETSASLFWKDNSSNETAFVVYSSLDGETFIQIGALGANVTGVAVEGLTAGVRAWFRVTARNDNGESAPSNTVSVLTGSSLRRHSVHRP